MNLVLLAAGRGSRLPAIYRNSPKCLVDVNNKPIIEHNLKFFNLFKKKIIITGYKNQKLKTFIEKNNFTEIYNDQYQKTNMTYSFFKSEIHVDDEVVLCYGDIIFNYKLFNLLKKKENLIPVYSNWYNLWKKRMKIQDILNDAESLEIEKDYIISIGEKIKVLPKYQYMGIVKLTLKDFKVLKKFFFNECSMKMDMTSFINFAIQKKIIKFKATKYSNYWYEIDNSDDIKLANKEITW